MEDLIKKEFEGWKKTFKAVPGQNPSLRRGILLCLERMAKNIGADALAKKIDDYELPK